MKTNLLFIYTLLMTSLFSACTAFSDENIIVLNSDISLCSPNGIKVANSIKELREKIKFSYNYKNIQLNDITIKSIVFNEDAAPFGQEVKETGGTVAKVSFLTPHNTGVFIIVQSKQ